MRPLSFTTCFSLLRFTTVLAAPHNSSILQLPRYTPSTSTPPASLTPSNPLHIGDWPATPWTYQDYPIITKFQGYGRHISNTTLTSSIISSTLKIQETIIKKGQAPFPPSSGKIAFHNGIVTLYMVFTPGAQITREKVFGMLDYWRVHVGAFGAREIMHGEMGVERGWKVGAAFAILFDGI